MTDSKLERLRTILEAKIEEKEEEIDEGSMYRWRQDYIDAWEEVIEEIDDLLYEE